MYNLLIEMQYMPTECLIIEFFGVMTMGIAPSFPIPRSKMYI